MTPAQHGAQAASLLAQSPDALGSMIIPTANLAQIHAVLATTAGTGTNYAAAETALSLAENGLNPWQLARALAFAHLAVTA